MELVVVDEQPKGLPEFIIIFESFDKSSSAVFIISVAFVCDGPDPVGFAQLYQRMNRIIQVEILSYLESHANSQLSKLVNVEPSHAVLLRMLLGVGPNHSHLSQSTLHAGCHQGEYYQGAVTVTPSKPHIDLNEATIYTDTIFIIKLLMSTLCFI